MFKFVVVVFAAVVACATAKPGLLGAPLAYSAAPLVAAPAPVVTATSSQVVSRTYNGIAHAPLVAPVAPVAHYAAPLSAPLAYTAPLAAAPVGHHFVNPLAAPLSAYSAPLSYAHPAAYTNYVL